MAEALGSIGEPGKRIYSVSELNETARGILEESFEEVWIQGEISNFRDHSSGHHYFSLKDSRCQIAAVMFRGRNRGLRFRPEDGLLVLIRGRVTVYEPRGTYQVIVEGMEPRGVGALQLAFEQLKARLNAEGLFDPARKRPLPILPRRIGLITSPSGAAVRDLLQVLRRRYANLHITIFPTAVQGKTAAPEIAAALAEMNRMGFHDVLILARGGGSLEDLWPFNEEVVARAIAASRIPVISAVGHEIDFTIADFVADLRAPTPSAAAEMVIETKAALEERISFLTAGLRNSVRLLFSQLRTRVEILSRSRSFRLVENRLGVAQQRVDDAVQRLRYSWRDRRHRLRERLQNSRAGLSAGLRMAEWERCKRRWESARGAVQLQIQAMVSRLRSAHREYLGRLESLSPLAVLRRGYAICRDSRTGMILRNAADTEPGKSLAIRLHQGGLDCQVKEVKS
ncbi:MAG: exodeoxyribonuclease VII large subunit [Acidobacteriota bacterium]